MSTYEKILSLVPYHEENFITSDTEYGFQLCVNIWQIVRVFENNRLIGEESDKYKSFQEFIDNELNENIGCYYELKTDYNGKLVFTDDKRLHVSFSFKSKVDIGIEGAIDNITLDDLLDDAIKVVNFFKNK